MNSENFSCYSMNDNLIRLIFGIIILWLLINILCVKSENPSIDFIW